MTKRDITIQYQNLMAIMTCRSHGAEIIKKEIEAQLGEKLDFKLSFGGSAPEGAATLALRALWGDVEQIAANIIDARALEKPMTHAAIILFKQQVWAGFESDNLGVEKSDLENDITSIQEGMTINLEARKDLAEWLSKNPDAREF